MASLSSRIGTDGGASNQIGLTELIDCVVRKVEQAVPCAANVRVEHFEVLHNWLVYITERGKDKVEHRPFVDSELADVFVEAWNDRKAFPKSRVVARKRLAGHRVVLEVAFDLPESIELEF